MVTTLTRPAVALPTPAVLDIEDLVSVVALTHDGEASCHHCGEDIYTLDSALSPWIDTNTIDDDAHNALREHLENPETRRSCHLGG
ncbi:hypothetical protein [Nocardiopsis sp. LOL_012]|uniref:hypothetical protein n=1 Tax=Nocardiopsis sp. LOL_012 TaxID=3345409 RepID=UPI003A8C439F